MTTTTTTKSLSTSSRNLSTVLSTQTPNKNINEIAYMWFIQCIILCVGIIFHCFGMVAIVMYKKKQNQNIILFCLSVSEFLVGITQLIKLGVGWISNFELRRMYLSIELLVHLEFLMMMLIITLDRLICMINPLLYKVRVTRQRLILIICLSFLLSFGVTGVFWTNICIGWEQILYTCVIGITVVLVLVTYPYVILKMKRSRKRFHHHKKKTSKKEFLVTGIIMVEFILFYCIPYPISIYNKESRLCHEVFKVLFYFGLAIDPVIYIFLTKHYRDIYVCHKYCKYARNDEENKRLNIVPCQDVDG